MRNHLGRTVIALGTLAASIALGSGIASAGPITITPDPSGGVANVQIVDPAPPALKHSCSVYGLGYAWGIADSAVAPAVGGFLINSPVVGVCTDGSWHFTTAG